MKKNETFTLKLSPDHLKTLKAAAVKATRIEKARVTASELLRRFIEGLK